MKKKIALVLIMIMLICTTAYADDEIKIITKEYEFTTTSDNFDYDVSEVITEEETGYILQDIEYQIMSEETLYETQTETFSQEFFMEGVEKDDDSIFEDSETIEEDGYLGNIPLNEVEYTERIVTGRTASHKVEYDFGLQMEKPTPASALDALYHDEETNCDVLVTLQFRKLKETIKPHWEDNIVVEHMYRSIYEDEYLLNDGTKLLFSESKPTYEGIEEKLLNQMGLPNSTYKITGSKWLGEQVAEEGVTSRLAGYTVERLVTGYKAIYSGTFDIPDMLVHDATAKYEGELSKRIETGIEYTVKVIATYKEIQEEKRNNTPAVVIGTSSGIIALCGLVVLLKKRKAKKGRT